MGRKFTKLQSEQLISSSGTSGHMAYHADAIGDVVSHLSVPGEELLNPEFSAFIDRFSAHVPGDLPLVLEISGCEFTAEEQEIIKNAVWNQYHIRLSGIRHKNRMLNIRMGWFLVCFILSAVLLFIPDDNTDVFLTQLYYLPFWFFGYRLLTNVFLDQLPAWREMKKCVQTAGIRLFFTGRHPVNDVPEGMEQTHDEEVAGRIADWNSSDFSKLRQYMLREEDGTASIDCHIDSTADVVPPSAIQGYEVCSDEFAAWLEQVIPYIPHRSPAAINIMGAELDEDEKKTVERAIRSHFDYRLEGKKTEEKRSMVRIIIFFILLIVSGTLLVIYNKIANTAQHELINMALWFFGDYLVEYVLLDHIEIVRERLRLEKMRRAEIRFKK